MRRPKGKKQKRSQLVIIIIPMAELLALLADIYSRFR